MDHRCENHWVCLSKFFSEMVVVGSSNDLDVRYLNATNKAIVIEKIRPENKDAAIKPIRLKVS